MANYLVLGSGAREHALAYKLSLSTHNTVHVAPGNPGIAQDPNITAIHTININNFDEVAALVETLKIDMVVVGPEAPLANGIVDELEKRNIKIFGPNQKAAQLETSKAFAKKILDDAGVKTAKYHVFNDLEALSTYLQTAQHPLVIKANGLAAGKGVFICNTYNDSQQVLTDYFSTHKFGAAGETVVVEEMLKGPEMSFMVITDGQTIVPIATSRDHKRLLDGDQGPNTGGMGAITPSPDQTPELFDHICTHVFEPVLKTLRDHDIEYKGFLYAGLMLTEDGPYVLEFNVRMGDPETQALILGMQHELAGLLERALEGSLDQLDPEGKKGVVATNSVALSGRPACCIVLASNGYPASSTSGDVIQGLDDIPTHEGDAEIKIFYAGVAEKEGELVTHGGRVLSVTASAETLEEALQSAYKVVDRLTWPGMQFRKDIGRTSSYINSDKST